MATDILTPAKVLRGAIERLGTDGWTQGRYHDNNGCHCADGALSVAAGLEVPDGKGGWKYTSGDRDRAPYLAAFRAACRAAGRAGHPRESIIDYNDEDGRTQGEVIAVLRDALTEFE